MLDADTGPTIPRKLNLRNPHGRMNGEHDGIVRMGEVVTKLSEDDLKHGSSCGSGADGAYTGEYEFPAKLSVY